MFWRGQALTLGFAVQTVEQELSDFVLAGRGEGLRDFPMGPCLIRGLVAFNEGPCAGLSLGLTLPKRPRYPKIEYVGFVC